MVDIPFHDPHVTSRHIIFLVSRFAVGPGMPVTVFIFWRAQLPTAVIESRHSTVPIGSCLVRGEGIPAISFDGTLNAVGSSYRRTTC